MRLMVATLVELDELELPPPPPPPPVEVEEELEVLLTNLTRKVLVEALVNLVLPTKSLPVKLMDSLTSSSALKLAIRVVVLKLTLIFPGPLVVTFVINVKLRL